MKISWRKKDGQQFMRAQEHSSWRGKGLGEHEPVSSAARTDKNSKAPYLPRAATAYPQPPLGGRVPPVREALLGAQALGAFHPGWQIDSWLDAP